MVFFIWYLLQVSKLVNTALKYNAFMSPSSIVWYQPSPLPSARQHPSYGDCLEVKREYYQNSSVLHCCIVWHSVHSQQHIYMSSSYRSNKLGLSHWDPYVVYRCGCLELCYCNMVEWFWWDSSLISTTNWFPSVLWHCWFGHLACKNRPWNDLLCVEWDVKPYKLTLVPAKGEEISLAGKVTASLAESNGSLPPGQSTFWCLVCPITHNISLEAENTFISAVIPKHCPLVASP